MPTAQILRCVRLVLAAGVLCCAGHAQVFEVKAGSSSLLQAQGGTLTVRGASYDASVGLGLVAGRTVVGANVTKLAGGSLYTLGSHAMVVNLPTDVFNSGHVIYATGASVRRKPGGGELTVFGGATSKNYGSPFFDGMTMQEPLGVMLWKRALGEHVTASSQVMVTRKVTALSSVAWTPSQRWQLAASGGVGANAPYVAASVSGSKRWMDLQAAYIKAGGGFRRVEANDAALLQPEPYGLNLQMMLRPSRHVSLGFGRQNYLVPLPDSAESAKSRVDNVSLAWRMAGAEFSANVFRSEYAGRESLSEIVSASRQVTRRVQVAVSCLHSESEDTGITSNVIATVEETVGPRWTLNQTLSSAGGQTNVGLGGSFLSNLATLSADYETYYVPGRAEGPFEQALITNADVNLPRGVVLHAGTFVGPTGKLLYTGEVRALMSRDGAPVQAAAPMGGMIVRGRVVDTDGRPVSGAALLINAVAVYTDGSGCFSLRERQTRTHTLTVLVDQFMEGGRYRVVSAPATVRSEGNENAVEAVVVVARI